jgi:arylsulfatase A-like enzyme
LGYYHFFPPHHPYNTRADFYEIFAEDEYKPVEKPKHFFGSDKPQNSVNLERRWYDEFVLYVDSEFARLYRFMEQSGILENTWVVLTTDHGEMFERGIVGHITQSLHQPVIHVPMLIFPPGQRERMDVHEVTSAIDLLPTLLHVTGQEIAEWAEGAVMPPFSSPESMSGREIFALHGDTDKNGIINRGTAMLTKENYKLMWYFGYEELQDIGDMIELYDLSTDPEELDNLYPKRRDIADEFIERLGTKLNEAESIQNSG